MLLCARTKAKLRNPAQSPISVVGGFVIIATYDLSLCFNDHAGNVFLTSHHINCDLHLVMLNSFNK